MDRNERLIELDDHTAWAVTTEEFLAQIHRSSELMRQDRGEEARTLLTQAFESRTDDPSGQATLGLVYFKLGIYPRALAIYQRLVRDFPSEPTLRLNLGLIYLKTGQTEAAARELEATVKLSSDYRKAHGYLGLAYQRLGDYMGAKRAFERAGVMHLAERMSRFSAPVHNGAKDMKPSCGNLDLVYEAKTEADGDGFMKGLSGFILELPFSSAAPSMFPMEGHCAREPVSVAELTAKAKIPEPLGSRFLISDAGYLLVDVRERGISQLKNLHFLCASSLSYKPMKRCFRGKECDELFGSEETRLYEIIGNGRLGFHPGSGVFTAFSLDGDAAFIREEYLFAMDPALCYENGKIPNEGSMLVHLSGRGAAALITPTQPTCLEVTPSSGVIIQASELVGWFGRLLPKKAASAPFDPSFDTLEIIGEGVVLFCLK
jgi:hypothetical protein